MTLHMHHVERVAIADLRPTQLTVGYREVAAKRAQWAALSKADRKRFLGGHVVPTVLGPRRRSYVVDHHHLARALEEDGHETILVGQLADLSALEKPEFWLTMDHRNWVYPYDANGVRQAYDAVPKAVAALADDPWRSLAGEARNAGGYAKVEAPFAEFLWADYFRRRIDPALLARDFDAALAAAMRIAHATAGAHLPGWTPG